MNRKYLLYRSLVLVFLLLWRVLAIAQTSITGDTCAIPGTQYMYVIAGDYSDNTTMTWSVTGGTIVGSYTGTPLPRIYVSWNVGGGTLSVTTTTPTGNASMNVNTYSALSSGSLLFGANQSILTNTVPDSIMCGAPSGGYCTPSYQYQWWYSIDGESWSQVSGATSLTLNFGTTPLTQTTYYKLGSTELNTGTTVYSSVATVTVYPIVVSGVIRPASQTINYGRIPAPLTDSGISGGSGTYVYQWQSAPDSSGPYTNIGGAITNPYSPGAMTSSAWFRVVASSAGDTVTSAPAAVNVNPQVVPGMIAPSGLTISSGTSPGLM